MLKCEQVQVQNGMGSSAALRHGQVASLIPTCLAFHCDSVSVDTDLVSLHRHASRLAPEHPLRE